MSISVSSNLQSSILPGFPKRVYEFTYPCDLDECVLRVLWDDEALFLHGIYIDELHVDVEPRVDRERGKVPPQLFENH